MNRSKYLIVNADDFGQSAGINRGIVEAHERGIVTSASLMVRWPAANDAAAYAREHRELSVGLHFDLGEWAYRDETWAPIYEVCETEDGECVRDELARQLDLFRSFVGSDPTHLDSHQHVHLSEPARSVCLEFSRELEIPLRGCAASVRYCGDFYGQCEDGSRYPEGISVERLVQILATLPDGVTELACHPGREVDLDTMYRDEREREVESLCDARVPFALAAHGIELISFNHLKRFHKANSAFNASASRS